MKFCSIRDNDQRKGAILIGQSVVTFSELNSFLGFSLPLRLFDLIHYQGAEITALRARKLTSDAIGKPANQVHFTFPFNEPSKILGIGLNYRDHARDLDVATPDEPASFMKPRTTIVGPDDVIQLPPQSNRVTAEAELGIVIGKSCKRITEQEADGVVFGYVPILDMTAEDILQRNPRFLTRAKSFDTFLSFGPCILTPDEITDIAALRISTVLNGKEARSNTVSNMIFSPRYLISFHSHVMTFEPGDLISTGTPGAVVIHEGDSIECKIDGFPTLSNKVRGPE